MSFLPARSIARWLTIPAATFALAASVGAFDGGAGDKKEPPPKEKPAPGFYPKKKIDPGAFQKPSYQQKGSGGYFKPGYGGDGYKKPGYSNGGYAKQNYGGDGYNKQPYANGSKYDAFGRQQKPGKDQPGTGDVLRALFTASPIPSDEVAIRLRDTLQKVERVREVGLKAANEEPQTGIVLVSCLGKPPVESLVKAAFGMGVTLKLVEMEGGDKPGKDYPPGDKPGKDFPPGDKPGKDFPPGDKPGKDFPPGDKPGKDFPPDKEVPPGKDGEGDKTGETSRALFLAAPLRSDAEALRLRDALQKVERVRDVGLQAVRERPGTGLVHVVTTGGVPVEALVKAARSVGVQLQLAEVPRR